MNKLTDFFKLLSDETRLRILVLLFHQEYCVCELYGILGEPQPKVSKHLARLRDLGLVKDIRREQFIYYSLILDSPFYEILQKIVNSASVYPIIQEDIKRSVKARAYLESCADKEVPALETNTDD